MSRPLKMLSFLKFLRNHTKITTYNGVYSLAHYSREINVLQKDDYLLSDLKNVNSAPKVLNMVSKHITIMNQKHILQALNSLFNLQKSGKSRLNNEEILRDPNFEHLCRCLKKQIRKLEVNEGVEALKTLSYLGVRGDSIIMQSILQMMRHYINDFSPSQIIFLDYVLGKVQSSPLRDALGIALPLVFQCQLYKVDKENIKEIISCLHFISKKRVSERCTKELILALINCIDNNMRMSGKEAKSLLWSASQLKESELLEPLIHKTIPFFLNDLNNLQLDDIETTLQLLLNKYSTNHPYYYSSKLLDGVANHFIEKDVGFVTGVYCLYKFTKVGHFNDLLLNYVASKCEEDPNLILNGNSQIVFSLCSAIAATDYRPSKWETIKQYIKQTDIFRFCSPKDFSLIKLCAVLCTLDIYKKDVFKNCLNEEYIGSIAEKTIASNTRHFLTVIQTITAFKSDFMNLLPPQNYINEFVKKSPPIVDFPLEAPLQKALGGDTYVANDVITELGLPIDHVTVMRKGGYPVAFNKQEKVLENIEVSPDNQIVLILTLRPWHYSINCRRMKGYISKRIQTLEANGYAVVPICLQEWESLADFEKLPYLMQAVKLKVEDFRSLSTVNH